MFGSTKKEIRFHEKYAKDLWVVEVDQGQIRQALLNLYVNAWQAMPDGGDLYIQTDNITLDGEYQVLVALSGEEALDIYGKQKNEIDLVMLDMVMPGMGGGETFDRLKAPDGSVRVLLSSGYSINGRAQEILDRGCRGFTQKPFTLW